MTIHINQLKVSKRHRIIALVTVMFALVWQLGSYVHQYANNSQAALTEKVMNVLTQEGRGLNEVQQADLAQQIVRVAQSHDMDPLLVLSVIKVESAFRPTIKSHAGAIGLMQVKPVVVVELNGRKPLKGVSAHQLLEDPAANVEIGVKYLAQLREKFGSNNWYHVLAAYNMGPTLVGRQVKRQQDPSRKYYSKVMKAYRDFRHSAVEETI